MQRSMRASPRSASRRALCPLALCPLGADTALFVFVLPGCTSTYTSTFVLHGQELAVVFHVYIHWLLDPASPEKIRYSFESQWK